MHTQVLALITDIARHRPWIRDEPTSEREDQHAKDESWFDRDHDGGRVGSAGVLQKRRAQHDADGAARRHQSAQHRGRAHADEPHQWYNGQHRDRHQRQRYVATGQLRNGNARRSTWCWNDGELAHGKRLERNALHRIGSNWLRFFRIGHRFVWIELLRYELVRIEPLRLGQQRSDGIERQREHPIWLEREADQA
jgi:hypothetical protein